MNVLELKSQKRTPEISFIILTKNSMKTLPRCIRAIKKQRISKEIIVVDGKSTDNTRRYAKSHANKLIIDVDSLSLARNLGMLYSSGRYISFIDSDIVIPDNWATHMLDLLKDLRIFYHKLVSVSSVYRQYPDKDLNKTWNKVHKPKVGFRNSGYMQSSIFVADIAKQFIIDANRNYSGEDLDLFYQMSERGYMHYVDGNISVRHYVYPSIIKDSVKSYYYGVDFVNVCRKHKKVSDGKSLNTRYFLAIMWVLGIFTLPFFESLLAYTFMFPYFVALLFSFGNDVGFIDSLKFAIYGGTLMHFHAYGVFVGTVMFRE